MPKALMGFPLQSLLPKLKLKTLTGFLLPCGSFPKQLPDSFETDEWMRTHASKFYSSVFAVFSMRGINSHQKPYAPLRLSPLRLPPEQ
jgi:glutathione peroxidase-family protein